MDKKLFELYKSLVLPLAKGDTDNLKKLQKTFKFVPELSESAYAESLKSGLG